jgi:anti-sigma factor RsiW
VKRHPDTELLSSYLDSELSTAEAGRLQEHLRGCPPCTDRLASLRHTVDRLRTLQRPVPPAAVAEELRARLPGARRPPAWRQRFERVVREGLVLQPAIATGFALVLGLAVIVYFQSHRAQPRRTTILVVPPVQVPREAAPGPQSPPAVAKAEAADQAASAGEAAVPEAVEEPRSNLERRREFVGAAALEARRDEPPLEQRAAGRTFVMADGIWVENGLGDRQPSVRLSAASEAAGELLRRFPELEALLRARAVRLQVDGRVVEIERAP